MKPWTLLRGGLVACLSLLLCGSGFALPPTGSTAQAPGPNAPPPLPPNTVLTPTAMDVAGISAGSPMTLVDAKCKEAGVKCATGTRTLTRGTLNRVYVDLPSGPYVRAVVTAKGGHVIAVKGTYRTADQNRMRTLTATYGNSSTLKNGLVIWNTSGGMIVSAEIRGHNIQFLSPAAATAKGFPVNVSKYLAPSAVVRDTLPAAGSLAPLRISPLVGGRLPEPMNDTPTITTTYRIPVEITLLQLRCVDEQDETSVFHGDDPYMNITGTHSSKQFPTPWTTRKSYSDVSKYDVKDISLPIFADSDRRRTIGHGEAVGVDVTLLESDVGNDDEIDYAYIIVDYAFALANQNQSIQKTQVLGGAGGKYDLSYRLDIGAARVESDYLSYPHPYRAADASTYAGNYTGYVGDQPAAASLMFIPSKDPAFPAGILRGSFTDGSTATRVFTTRLHGASGELGVRYPSGSSGAMNIYLMDSGRTISGTIVRDGITRGIHLTKK